MLSSLALIPLLVLIYLRPQEVFESLQQVPLLYAFAVLAAVGAVIDVRVGRTRLAVPPQLPWVLGFLAWTLLSIVLKTHSNHVVPEIVDSMIGLSLFVLIGSCVQGIRNVRIVASTLVLCSLFLTVVGIHQGLAETGCVLLDETNAGAHQQGAYDGRWCKTAIDCYGDGASPGGDYVCEHIGLLGTTTVNKRIRYRGILQDPNELAMTLVIALPLLFALAFTGRGFTWRILAVLGTIAVLIALLMTESRTGQLCVATAMGVVFVHRFGVPGAAVAAFVSLPVLVFGGRSGASAGASVSHRFESWQAGFDMMFSSPVLGVGKGMFVENNFLTAHNSYILASAELGVPGYVLWFVALFLSVKIPWAILRTFRAPEHRSTRILAIATLTSLACVLVAMMFLSLTYHYVPWIYLGLSGALYMSVKQHESSFRVRMTLKDWLLCIGSALGALAVFWLVLRVKGY